MKFKEYWKELGDTPSVNSKPWRSWDWLMLLIAILYIVAICYLVGNP